MFQILSFKLLDTTFYTIWKRKCTVLCPLFICLSLYRETREWRILRATGCRMLWQWMPPCISGHMLLIWSLLSSLCFFSLICIYLINHVASQVYHLIYYTKQPFKNMIVIEISKYKKNILQRIIFHVLDWYMINIKLLYHMILLT